MECIDPINEITLTHGFRQERISCGRVQNSSNRWMVEIVSLCHARSRTARRNPDRMNVAAASRSQLAVEHARDLSDAWAPALRRITSCCIASGARDRFLAIDTPSRPRGVFRPSFAVFFRPS